MITSIVVILILYQFNTNSISKGGGFERHFKFSKLELSDTLDLQYNSYYLAGASMKKIYLGNKNVPFQLLEVSNTLKESSPAFLFFETRQSYLLLFKYHLDKSYFLRFMDRVLNNDLIRMFMDVSW